MGAAHGRILIVGVDGTIGSALWSSLQNTGHDVWGTTRRPGPLASQRFRLDLSDAESLARWNPPTYFDVAILCAGVTRLIDCKKYPQESRAVNVQGMVLAARKLKELGSFVIALSTNQVFDGSVALRKPDADRCPINEYGWQKAEAERELVDSGIVNCIVRLSKVLGPTIPLFEQWRADLGAGKQIYPFSDMTLSPVPLGTVTRALRMLATHRGEGIFQMSGEIDMSYADAAVLGAKTLGSDIKLVVPKICRGSDNIDPPPRYTSLCSAGIEMALGITIPPVAHTLSIAFLDSNALAAEGSAAAKLGARGDGAVDAPRSG